MIDFVRLVCHLRQYTSLLDITTFSI